MKSNNQGAKMNTYKDKEYKEQRKHVFKNSEIEHIWASQTLASGRNPQNNIFFKGPSLYSYGHHFETARFVAPKVVLLTTRRYSVTTSGHVSAAHRAVSHCQVFEVPNFDDFDASAKYYLDSISTRVATIKRARSGFNWHLCELSAFCAEAALFIKTFSKQINKTLRAKVLAAARKKYFSDKQLKEFKVKEARSDESTARAKVTRERNEKIRWQQRQIAYAEQSRIKDEMEAFQVALDEARSEKNQNEMVVIGELWEPEILELNRMAWQSCDETANDIDFYDVPVMLRVLDGNIETSRGAAVPLIEARKLWHALEDKKSVIGMRVGHYTVDRLEENQIVIGCHEIALKEIARTAVSLGWHLQEVI